MTHPFRISETSRGCYLVDMDIPRDQVESDWSQTFLLRSDAHHDNAHSDHRLELSHLVEAEERDAGILDAGDLFCAMQGKWDKRASTDGCRPEHREGRYLDSLVETATDFYQPFASRWLLLAPGNHEGSILKRHETDLTDRLAAALRGHGSNVIRGTYSGFVRFRVCIDGQRTLSRVLYYHHGHGGGGLMTHGVLNTRRRQSFLSNADIVWSGHTHDSWSVRLSRVSLTSKGRVRREDVHHVSTPGYKEEFTPMDGWHVERGAPPKPLGAAWLRFYLDRSDDSRRLAMDISEAR